MPKLSIEFVYSGLRCRDLERSLRFYRKLGFRRFKGGTMDHGGKWRQLTFPGTDHRLELNYYPRGTRFAVPWRTGTEFDHLGFRVSNVEDMEARVRRARIPIVARIREPYENLLYVRDPDGNWLEFFGPPPKG